MSALEDYLLTMATAINSENGVDLARHFDFADSHRKLISHSLRKLPNLREFITNRIPEPWSEIAYQHCNIISQRPTNDHSKIADLQVELVQKLYTIFPGCTKWILPVVYAINKNLQSLAISADRKLAKLGEKADNLEKAARTINKAFSIAAVDRISPPSESRKWGVYQIVNLLFITYFKLGQINLCGNILKSMASADLFPLDQYPKSEQVTFKYFCGVLSFYNENFEQAFEELGFAFRHCGCRNDRKSNLNKTMILRYLVPTMLLKGILPSPKLFAKYPGVQIYQGLANAIKLGNLQLFDATMLEYQHTMIKWGTWLIVERSRLIVYRTLCKNILSYYGNEIVPIDIFRTGLAFSLGFTQMQDLNIEECCVVIVNLIDQGYMKGYISQEKQVVVLSKNNPFPAFK